MTIPYASTALDLMMNLLPHLYAVVVEVRVHDKNLADELFRAAKSVALNLSEADGVRKGHRKERIGTAAGSCAEAITAVRMARAFGFCDGRKADFVVDGLTRVAQMTHRRLYRAG